MTGPPDLPRPRVPMGTVLDVAEGDYRYGVGRLKLRLAAVLDARRQTDGMWVQVCGVVIRWDGRDGEHREAWVRATALPPATVVPVR